MRHTRRHIDRWIAVRLDRYEGLKVENSAPPSSLRSTRVTDRPWNLWKTCRGPGNGGVYRSLNVLFYTAFHPMFS